MVSAQRGQLMGPVATLLDKQSKEQTEYSTIALVLLHSASSDKLAPLPNIPNKVGTVPIRSRKGRHKAAGVTCPTLPISEWQGWMQSPGSPDPAMSWWLTRECSHLDSLLPSGW